MFDIHSIEYENFKSYRGEHRFVFPTAPGLYFITGDNQLEPRLGSNGAGKSTFLDAIYWCLYGKTLRGLKASDVITWGEKHCAVTVNLTVAGKQTRITREQGPNKLEIDGRLVDQEAVTRHIGLNEDSFVYAVILPQFGQSFFELTPTNKLGLFSQILNLDKWLDCSQRASVKAAVLETTVKQLLQRAESGAVSVAALTDEIEQLGIKEAAYEKERKVFEAEVEREIDECDISILGIRAKIRKAAEDHEKADKERALKRKQMATIEAAHEKYIARRDTNSQLCATLKTKLDAAESMFMKLGKLSGTCPSCLQEVDGDHLQTEKKRLKAELYSLKLEYKEAATAYQEAQRFVVKTRDDLTQAARAVTALDGDVTAARITTATAESEIKMEKAKAARLKQQLQDEKDQSNPYTEMIAQRQTQLATTKAKVQQQRDEALKVGEEYQATSFWVGGFKRVRLFLIEETLRAFELEVNSSLASLGLTDWRIEFDVERENKSGGITKGFTVFVTNATHPEPVRFEAWSGGEAQRLQLAGDLGLANLIMLQAGLTSTIEFYDEPSRHLSRAGLLDLAETLHQRALSDQKRIFLIDHNTIEFGEFVDVIRVIKTEHGSKLVSHDSN